MTEPMHDIKNFVECLFQELPAHIPAGKGRELVDNYITTALGK
jgi:hypothetical protein